MADLGAAARSADPLLAAALERFRGRWTRDVAVAVVDLEADSVIRTAWLGHADGARRFEIGSVSKGLTGMVIADAIERGELTLDTRVADLLEVDPASALCGVTLAELCTHTSGLPRLGWGISGLAALAPLMLIGLDPYRGIAVGSLLTQAGRMPLPGRGRYRYSNLGGAIAGQMAAAAAGVPFEELLAQRVFEPLGMGASSVSRRGATAPWGHSPVGMPREPWVLGGYSPAGGVVSTAADMGALLRGLLDGSAPGARALERVPDVATESAARASALFWVVQVASRRLPPPFVWHNGGTGGYSSFVLLQPDAGRGVAVLASVSRAEEQQEIAFALAESAV